MKIITFVISQYKDNLCSLEQTSASNSLVISENPLLLLHSTQQEIQEEMTGLRYTQVFA